MKKYFLILGTTIMTCIIALVFVACGGDDISNDSGGGTASGGGGQQESFLGEWLQFIGDDEIEVINLMPGGKGTYTGYWYENGAKYLKAGWYYSVESFTYTINGNQGVLIFSNGKTHTFTYSIQTTENGTYLRITTSKTEVYMKMTSEMRTAINSLNATRYEEGASVALTGDWYAYKKSSKGEAYCILSFNSGGSGRYQEYDKDTDGNVKTTDKNFNFVYAGGKLTITWTGGKSETIDVVSYNPNWELVLNNWPDKGNNTFYPLTDEISKIIDEFKNGSQSPKSAYLALLAGSSSKEWVWDSTTTGWCWGIMSYCGGSGEEVGINGHGQWWGVASEEDFQKVLYDYVQPNDKRIGGTSMDAYMVFTTDGKITSYNAAGVEIQKGTFELEDIDNNEWKVANLHTTAGAILWPFDETVTGGVMPTLFEVVYLSNNKMTLVYPYDGKFETLGNGTPATFWHFKRK